MLTNSGLSLLPALFMLLWICRSNAQTGNASCSDAYKFPPGSDFGKNIPTVLSSLLQNGSATGYSTVNVGNGPDTVYGLLQCRGDITPNDCKICASTAINILNTTCVRNSTRGGRVQLLECFLRYEDHFFSSNLDVVSSLTNCSLAGNATKTFGNNWQLVLDFLLNRVPTSASKFVVASAGSGTSSQVFALGQCVRDLSPGDCGTCLSSAETALANTCTGETGGACYYSTCMLQYESTKFFLGNPLNATLITSEAPSGNSTNGSSRSSKSKIIGYTVGAAAGAILLLLLVVYTLARVYITRRDGKRTNGGKTGETLELQSTLYRGPVTFTYEMLKRCTDNFDESLKLGEGGFGSVYKAVFSDGTQVAVKKLSVASKQGENQFLNEVKVISTVQHRNLVRLLGCCVEGTERLLVYEFCKNNSLEKLLFEESSSLDSGLILPWNTRLSILLGTARGLTYLHEDSQVRIVHRDIKPSNILLDEALEAKIADFGLARLCSDDEVSHIVTTKIAGTYGYMSPEYAFHGQLSEKADVFSFGS